MKLHTDNTRAGRAHHVDTDAEPWHLPHMGNRANDEAPAVINTTTRRFPRLLAEAFPHIGATSAIGVDGPVVIPTRTWRGALAAALRDVAAILRGWA